jgi:hypothetical protein
VGVAVGRCGGGGCIGGSTRAGRGALQSAPIPLCAGEGVWKGGGGCIIGATNFKT